ncbi:hypothetical protein Hanom_Chr06g00492091 [Helianthus anomalus]
MLILYGFLDFPKKSISYLILTFFFFFFERQIWITDGLLEYHRATSRTTRSYPSPLGIYFTHVSRV